MSIFASRATKTLEIPFDPPHCVTIQRLSGRQLAKAASAHQLASIEAFRAMGGAAFQKELQSIGDPETRATAIAEAKADPLGGYDLEAIIKYGVREWSYRDEQNPSEMLEVKVDDLTEEAETWLATEILRWTKPALFQSAAEMEAETKNA